MSQFTEISPITALPICNNFTANQPVPPPFSFNPSLFYFYQNHFHWKPWYFLLLDDNKVAGLLPLVNTGKAWVSLPHFSYGGVFMKNNVQFDLEKLIKNLIVSVEEEKINPGFFQVDIKSRISHNGFDKKVYVRSLLSFKNELEYNKASSAIQLPATKNELFQQLSSNLRRKIHKAESSNFSVKQGMQELLDDFYAVYAKNMHRLGSPAYGKHFFSDLMNTYEFGETLFFVIYKEKKPVAASMLMSYNGFWENTWFSTKKETQKEYVSDFLHWQMIQYAIQRKAKIYSFGRSDADGNVFQYKNHWPVKNLPIYEYRLNHSADIKDHKWMAKLWRKIPYPVAYYLGPGLVRHIY
ncbi:MAG TPA: GNAT family N-acetyltransferase [Bacteroidetes bacterium]|nr:GNAT family N-acetyltransferase [Bacteroidota bacterium]